MQRILAVDIGGTNSRFGCFASDQAGLRLEQTLWLPTAESASFEDLMGRLAGEGFPLDPVRADAVAVAIAGAVRGSVRADPPNIAWSVDLSRARSCWGWKRFALMNDFAAQAYACCSPVMDRALEILPGRPEPEAVMAVLGAGTGLGSAMLAPDGRGGHVALPGEGGHATFPFAGDEEFEFFRFLQQRTGRLLVIGDMVVAGSGLSALHAFLTGQDLEPAQVALELDQGSLTLEWFARFYGRAARNLALSCLALGGVLVSGGLAARNPVLVTHPAFAREFRSSETQAALLADIPVRLSVDQDLGLWGAAFMARLRLLEPPGPAARESLGPSQVC